MKVTVGNSRDLSLLLREEGRVPLYLSLILLLVTEVVWLTVRFDTETLELERSFWAQAIGFAPQYLRFAITALAVTILFGGKALWTEFRRGHSKASRPTLPYLIAGHFVAILAFAWVTRTLLDGEFFSISHQPLWVTGWFLAGAAALGLWGLAAMSAASWVATAKRARAGLLWGVAVATVVSASGVLTQMLWKPLAAFTYGLVVRILGLLYDDVVSNPARLIVGTPGFKVEISPECSGYEGIGLVLAFLGLYLWHFRQDLRFPRVLMLLPIGVVAIWVLNLARIVALVAIGTSGSAEIARGGFHSQVGWIAFNAVSLGLVAITMRTRYFATANERQFASPDGTAAYLAPFLAIIATAMVTGAVSGQFDWLYPIRVIAGAGALWAFRGTFARLQWRLSWIAVPFGIAAFLLWLVLAPAESLKEQSWPPELHTVPFVVAALWFVVKVIGYVITVPLAEELAFRGFLTRRLMRADFERVAMGTFSWPSFLISSLLFGAMHGQLWLAGTVSGMVFAVALYWRRSVSDAVQAHAITNALIVLYVLATGRWSMWS